MKKNKAWIFVSLLTIIILNAMIPWAGFLWIILITLVVINLTIGRIALSVRNFHTGQWVTVNSLLFVFLVFGLITDYVKPYTDTGAGKNNDVSASLKEMYSTDQEDRKRLRTYVSSKDLVIQRDSLRLVTVLDWVSMGMVTLPLDKFYAAMILQHGYLPEHFELAFKLAKEASTSKEKINNAEWLFRASYDRWQLSLGKPHSVTHKI